MSEIPVTRDPVCGMEVNPVATRVAEQTKEAQ
jgi:YHS domain-containing protein